MNILLIAYISFITIFIASTLGACMVFFINKKISVTALKFINGFASGVMISAAIFGLIIPAIELNVSSSLRFFPVIIGILLGTIFLITLDLILNNNKNKSVYKLFSSMTLHNAFEGLAIGLLFSLAYNNSSASFLISAISLTMGISLQNIPETFALSTFLYKNIKSKKQTFFYCIISSIIEPIFAIVGFITIINLSFLMPYFLSFAGGSMLYLTIEELLPVCYDENEKYKFGLYAFILGFCLMIILESI